ncbi:uncharacterized protein KGF55_002495 [Candida pseudojiufengensis]|uniref:uncharacterized protein n=1 Tax=Candida pseudojiufengensis TaxID=497109 RepID=UPI002225344D|nr:uncharacterized protein KGF55_002495 [Candida pseudojiufengensis]KAI5963615.1 hypothetical protein KGF55_002495 [Candida pseudojiufengensis]
MGSKSSANQNQLLKQKKTVSTNTTQPTNSFEILNSITDEDDESVFDNDDEDLRILKEIEAQSTPTIADYIEINSKLKAFKSNTIPKKKSLRTTNIQTIPSISLLNKTIDSRIAKGPKTTLNSKNSATNIENSATRLVSREPRLSTTSLSTTS